MNKNPRFKEHRNKDIRRIFLNENEFAEPHIVDGLRIYGVFTDTKVGTTSQTADRDLLDIGLVNSNLVFYCASDDLPESYMNKKKITIDGAVYQILRTSNEMGMIAFVLNHTESKTNERNRRDGFYI